MSADNPGRFSRSAAAAAAAPAACEDRKGDQKTKAYALDDEHGEERGHGCSKSTGQGRRKRRSRI